jgi:hypothetical protein
MTLDEGVMGRAGYRGVDTGRGVGARTGEDRGIKNFVGWESVIFEV